MVGTEGKKIYILKREQDGEEISHYPDEWLDSNSNLKPDRKVSAAYLPDEVNKLIFDKNIPIAQADFFFAKKNIVLFIDGGPHDKDYIIKADEKKRRELMNLGYRVYSIHYSRAEEDMQKLSIVLER